MKQSRHGKINFGHHSRILGRTLNMKNGVQEISLQVFVTVCEYEKKGFIVSMICNSS